jgi:hypothetical protein
MNILTRYIKPLLMPKKPICKLFVSAIIAAAAFTGSASSTIANDPIGDFVHTVNCAGLLFIDPARHLVECGVGKMDSTPLAKTGTGIGNDNPPNDNPPVGCIPPMVDVGNGVCKAPEINNT